MTVGEKMTKEAITYKARREWSHNIWVKRQADYKQIKERDCYGYKGAKVQNVGRVEGRSIKAC